MLNVNQIYQPSDDKNIVQALPAAFVHCEKNKFLVRGQVNDDDIIAAARALLLNRVKQFPVTLSNYNDAKELAKLYLCDKKWEEFCVMFLTPCDELISFEQLFRGSISEVTSYPRVVLQRALELNAEKVIVAHNHPSGICKPSTADKAATKDLQHLLGMINVTVKDHLIVSGDKVYSFAEKKKL